MGLNSGFFSFRGEEGFTGNRNGRNLWGAVVPAASGKRNLCGWLGVNMDYAQGEEPVYPMLPWRS